MFEVALWARHAGPVVLAPDRDGFREQVTDGVSGLLYHPHRHGALTAGIRGALALDDAARARLRSAAYQRVVATRDVVPSLGDTLRVLFHHQRSDRYAARRPATGTRPPRSQAIHPAAPEGGRP